MTPTAEGALILPYFQFCLLEMSYAIHIPANDDYL